MSSDDQLVEILKDRAVEIYGRGSAVENLVRLSGGASRETWSFDVRTAEDDSVPLILKRDPVYYDASGVLTSEEPIQVGVSRITEGRLMEQAAVAGVPVPEVVFYLTADENTSEGFVTRRLEGEALGLRI
ncbi:MAG: hypothetical protein HOE54_05005, partial [Gammaproteobacteria bacterium]|nr:hypothetical protein [Gammaproteobacteria bacterium]